MRILLEHQTLTSNQSLHFLQHLKYQREMQDQFMRIAMAQLRSTYPFKPQRRAVAARMWVKYLDRKAMAQWFKDQEASV
jgi:hypothetical protein